MSFTQADLDKIERAIAQGAGVVRVRYRDREVEYRGLDEMLRARDLIKRELGLAKKTHRIYPKHSKGGV